MNSERIRDIQETMTAYPNSVSVAEALRQVWIESSGDYVETEYEVNKLRDYFAGQAMMALLIADYTVKGIDISRISYEQADAMLKEREK